MPYFPDNTNPITNFDPLPLDNLQWQFSLPPTSLVYFTPNTSQTVADQTQTIVLPDYNALLGNQEYSEYRLFAEPTTPSTPTEINISSNIAANGSLVTSSNFTFQEIISFQDLETATPPQSSQLLRYERAYILKGKRIDNEEFETIVTYERNYAVQFVTAGNIYITPSQQNLAWVQGDQNIPEITVNVYAVEQFFVVLDESFSISGDNLPEPADFFGLTAYLFEVSTQFQLIPNQSLESFTDQLLSPDFFVFASLSSAPTQVQLSGNIYVASTLEYLVQPQSLNFLVILGSPNPAPQSLQIYGGGDFSITAPSWLSLSQNSGNGLANIDVFVVTQSLLVQGIFQNNIEITANGITYQVPVTMQVVNQFELNLSQSGINFTDDNQQFSVIYNNSQESRFVLANITISQIGYPNALALPKTFQYRLGFFNNQTKIHLGEIVKRALQYITANQVFTLFQDYINNGTVNTALFQYYKPSLVQVVFQLIGEQSNQTVSQAQFNLIRFATGRRPDFRREIALLNKIKITEKVTKNSVRMLNFLSGNNVVLEKYRNSISDLAFFIEIQIKRLYGRMVAFNDAEIGDVIEYRLHSGALSTQAIYLSYQFIVYPEPKQFNQIIFINEYRVPQFFDFCGDWRFTTENKLVQSKDYINLVEAIANEQSIENHSLSINTGYLPPNHDVLLEQLKRSRHCWLLGNDAEKLVELVPVAYSIANYDSDQDLYQYEVEFNINPTNDLQNYS